MFTIAFFSNDCHMNKPISRPLPLENKLFCTYAWHNHNHKKRTCTCITEDFTETVCEQTVDAIYISVAVKILLVSLLIVQLVNVNGLWRRWRKRRPNIPHRPRIYHALGSWTKWDLPFTKSCPRRKYIHTYVYICMYVCMYVC